MASFLTTQELGPALTHAVLGGAMAQGERTLGIEMERLILHRETEEHAPLDFCRQLLADIAADIDGKVYRDGEVINRVDGHGYSLTMEPGGQLELATDPTTQLSKIDPTMYAVRKVVEERLKGTDYELRALGHTPVTLPDDIGLLPRSRYRIMDRLMLPRGKLTRHMMRATAGFQLAYDFTDRTDAGRKLALLYRIAPLLMAVTANSRRVGGKDSGYASFRHHVWAHTDRDRVGVPDGCLQAETAVDGYLAWARRATVLFLRREGELVAAPEQSLEALVAAGQITQDDLELHLSSLFPHVRMRNYLEVRYLDAVPWQLARSVLAMLSGLVYCPTATARAEELSACLVPADDAALAELHEAAARDALAAQAPDGRGFRELAEELLSYSAATLGGKNCNWAEVEDLAAVRSHIAG